MLLTHGVLLFFIYLYQYLDYCRLCGPHFSWWNGKFRPTGRLAAAHPAFVTMGGAIGPMVMGYISDFGGFSLVGWFAMVIIVISIPMVMSGTKKLIENYKFYR